MGKHHQSVIILGENDTGIGRPELRCGPDSTGCAFVAEKTADPADQTNNPQQAEDTSYKDFVSFGAGEHTEGGMPI